MSTRYYAVPELNTEYVSVTSCDILDKSNALIPWAVGCAIRYVAKHKDELTADITEDRVREILVEAKNAHKEVSEEAKDIGSRTHEAIELWLKGSKVTPSPDIEKPFYAFLEWATKNNLEVLKTETTVYNHKEKYAGTCDLKAKVDGKVFVIDLKTSKAFYEPSMPMQVAAYAACYNDVEGIGVLRLDKETGEPHFKDYTDKRSFYYEGFLMLKDLFYMFYAKKALRKEVVKS